MDAVPSLTNLPDVADTGRAVRAVLGVFNAWSIVPGLPAWLPGLETPLRGLPDCEDGRNAWLLLAVAVLKKN